MKLNWDMLDTRPENETNDLLYYEDGTLAGYLGLYGFGSKPEEIEITGMVHPHYRRRGICSKLFSEAVLMSRSRGAGRMLLISERQSASGLAFAKKAGLPYSFSEYRMLCSTYQPQKHTEAFSLRPATDGDTPFLMKLDEICFEANSRCSTADPGRPPSSSPRISKRSSSIECASKPSFEAPARGPRPAGRHGPAAALHDRALAPHRLAQRQRGGRGQAHGGHEGGRLDRRVQRQHPVPAAPRRLFFVWIVLNSLDSGIAALSDRDFDPFPFGLLTMCVSLEAIFLSVFVLLSQNRQAREGAGARPTSSTT